jgi:hypothetical protein
MITQTHWYSPLLVLSLAKWIIVIPMKKEFIPMSNMIIILLSYYAIILLSYFREDSIPLIIVIPSSNVTGL